MPNKENNTNCNLNSSFGYCCCGLVLRLQHFVALNLGGPEIHSIFVNEHPIKLKGGLADANFKKLALLYKEVMSKIKSSCTPVLSAENETGIIAQITYNQ